MISWAGCAFYLLVNVIWSLLMFYGKTARLIYVVPSLLYTISFYFLLSALYTIRKVMKSLTDLVIIYEVFIFYAATALLAIIG